MLGLQLDHATYLGIILGLVLTGMGLPIPEEVLIIIAGVASNQGALNPWLALVACLVGAILGDCAMYLIGYQIGGSSLREHRWLTRFFNPEREQRMEQMIRSHGLKVLLAARFLVGVRSPVYVAAGILRVPFKRFVLVDTFCATAVVGTFFGASYALGEHIHGWWKWISHAELALTVGIGVAIAGVVLFFYLRRRRRWARVRQRRQRNLLKHAASSNLDATEQTKSAESKSVA